jgi:hypothetical protein
MADARDARSTEPTPRTRDGERVGAPPAEADAGGATDPTRGAAPGPTTPPIESEAERARRLEADLIGE